MKGSPTSSSPVDVDVVELTGCREKFRFRRITTFSMKALIIMKGCVSILQSIQTLSSPVDPELVNVVEMTDFKETEQNK